MPKCPVCNKELTPADILDDCPGSLYKHGKHPVIVMDWTFVVEKPLAWTRITNITVPVKEEDA